MLAEPSECGIYCIIIYLQIIESSLKVYWIILHAYPCDL